MVKFHKWQIYDNCTSKQLLVNIILLSIWNSDILHKKVLFLTHPWEPCPANHCKPDLYSHNNNNSFTNYTSIHGGSKHELAKNRDEI